jgi:NADP-dependent aldehyde dehydrogenase
MSVTGALFIGTREERGKGAAFFARDAASGVEIAPAFHEPSSAQIEEACRLAEGASSASAGSAPDRRADFLDAIASNLEALAVELLPRCVVESGLPFARLENELRRTTAQLRMFSVIARSGRYQQLDIEPSQAGTPLILKRVPLGPVAVFGASNFPLAFSAAGGDTASALAAGCPVIVKGHPAHPGTSEIVARAVSTAARDCGMPEGVFSLLSGASNQLGAALVTDPGIAAVAFTGSRRGGLALQQLAQQRETPIPVYAEMGSINPVVMLPGALKDDAKGLAQLFVSSLALGAGQFCTNPGVVFGVSGMDFDAFRTEAAAAIRSAAPQVMLTPDIARAYARAVETMTGNPSIEQIARGVAGTPQQCQANLLHTHVADFIADRRLHEEVFGASSLIVSCNSFEALFEGLLSLEGQLAASVFVGSGDNPAAQRLMPLLQRKAGRVILNDFATGVEVNRVMIHGGPYPATTDSRTTSVGGLAIERFMRPVCFQGLSPSSPLLQV